MSPVLQNLFSKVTKISQSTPLVMEPNDLLQLRQGSTPSALRTDSKSPTAFRHLCALRAVIHPGLRVALSNLRISVHSRLVPGLARVLSAFLL